jgi:hypothetical protein
MKYYDSFLGRAQYIERDLIIPSNTSLEEVEKMVKKEYPNYFFFNWKGLVVKRVPSEQKK